MNLDKINQPFTEVFSGDPNLSAIPRQTEGYQYTRHEPQEFLRAELFHFNKNLSEEIGLGELEGDEAFLWGGILPGGNLPYATGYAGHQFGNWAGQLGDGRALNIGEISGSGGRWELQWKGAGATAYSRRADGRAVLRSSIREYLMSEAMHHLGVPTTRALSLCLTGDQVVRDILYLGDPQPEPGAIVLRVAADFLRFGHIELASARESKETLEKIIRWVIKQNYSHLTKENGNEIVNFFRAVTQRTCKMVLSWYRTGFVHGVMNTDNMSLAGLTIDYGPYGMLEEYDLEYTPNTTDLPGRRYAFGRQAEMAHWNLYQLANALCSMIEKPEPLEEILDNFTNEFSYGYDRMMARKLGFKTFSKDLLPLITSWDILMQKSRLDYTLFFRLLAKYSIEVEWETHFKPAMYVNLSENLLQEWKIWTKEYLQRVDIDAKARMNCENPAFVLRNYLLYQAIYEIQNQGTRHKFNALWAALQDPYSEDHPEELLQRRPDGYDHIPGCSTLSCSS